jgi:hypothetical protein
MVVSDFDLSELSVVDVCNCMYIVDNKVKQRTRATGSNVCK